MSDRHLGFLVVDGADGGNRDVEQVAGFVDGYVERREELGVLPQVIDQTVNRRLDLRRQNIRGLHHNERGRREARCEVLLEELKRALALDSVVEGV